MNDMNNTTARYMIYRTVEAAQAAVSSASSAVSGDTAAVRIITARFRNPSRTASVIIPADAWTRLAAESIPATYMPLLVAVLDTAARNILSTYLTGYAGGNWPTHMESAGFSADAIIDYATGSNSAQMTREELTAAWNSSDTRKAFLADTRYADTAGPYRRAVVRYEELILKLAGRTTQYEPQELDLMLAKLHAADLSSDFGAYVASRIEQVRSRPAPAAVNLDLL